MLRLDLKKIRKDLSLTQRQLADVFNVPQSFISQIENGKDPMPAHWTSKLIEMLNIADLSFYQLITTDKEKESDVLFRLKQFFDAMELSQSHIAIQLGLTQRILINIFRGDAKLDLPVLVAISLGFPALNLNWLMRGEGEMLVTERVDPNAGRVMKLVDTIATLQDALNAKSETIAALTERIRELEKR